MEIREEQWNQILSAVKAVELKSQKVTFNASKKMTVFQLAHEGDLLRAAVVELDQLIKEVDSGSAK